MTIPVLAYHRVGIAPADAKHPDTYVSPRAFALQLRILKALGYSTISPRDYTQHRRGEEGALPAKPILITFDDGSSTVLSDAAPLLRRHGFTAVLFMVSSRMGQSAVWDGEPESASHRQLTAGELRALRMEGWAIGSHSVTHARMTELEPERRLSELSDSKAELEAAVGAELDWFAYPYGAFDPALRESVAKAGYRVAFATEDGDGNILSIPRRIIGGRSGLFKFLRRLYQARAMARR